MLVLVKPPDLSFLPPELNRRVRIDPNGETSWPRDQARSVIDALAGAGRLVLGLDMRRFDEQGRIMETAWSDFEPDREADHAVNVAAARRAALDALPGGDDYGDWVLITWDPR